MWMRLKIKMRELIAMGKKEGRVLRHPWILGVLSEVPGLSADTTELCKQHNLGVLWCKLILSPYLPFEMVAHILSYLY